LGDNGYISLHRKIFENKLWEDKPFSRAQAWIDLLLLAQYSDSSFFIRTIEIKVKRGQLAYSVKTLAKRWGWSRPKVDRFLKYLKNEHQIEHQKNNLTTLISIIKYEDYQNKNASERAPNVHQTCTKRAHNNKDNKDNNIYSRDFEETLSYWNSLVIITHNIKSKVVDNAKKKYKLKRKFYSHSDILQAITNYSKIYHDSDSFFKYRWSLDEFLGRENANKFFPDVFLKDNFYKTDLKNKSQFKGVRW
jgi:hypothetical protein